MQNKKIALFVGTRPEVIKMTPILLKALELGLSVSLIATGQQREMLYQTFKIFNIEPDINLKVISTGQSINNLSASLISKVGEFLNSAQMNLSIVQGDTASAFCSALASFNLGIPVAHIEAGLRSYDLSQPFPEEGYRKMIDHISSLHFAPTGKAAENLFNEGIRNSIITGNTGIDSLLHIVKMKETFTEEKLNQLDGQKKIILLTTHRRENQGDQMKEIFAAVNDLIKKYPDVQFIFPVHLNPKIQELAIRLLSNNDAVTLLPPLDYDDLILLLSRSWSVLTDSGGIQEEAPTFRIPIVVLREKTERQEIIENGNGILVGTDRVRIVSAVSKLHDDPSYYRSFGLNSNPFGDGLASQRILNSIVKFFN